MLFLDCRKVIRAVLIIVIVHMPASPVFADDTLLGESGHTVCPINTDKIQLEYEHVVIKMDGGNYHREATVTCEFAFRNTSPEPITAKVGFPGNETTDDRNRNAAPNLTLFTALVDGKEKMLISEKKC